MSKTAKKFKNRIVELVQTDFEAEIHIVEIRIQIFAYWAAFKCSFLFVCKKVRSLIIENIKKHTSLHLAILYKFIDNSLFIF